MNKIGPNSSHTPPENPNANRGVITNISGERRSVSSNSVSASSDTVALSSQAIDMSALESSINQLPDIDSARVVELHNRIMAGEYQIDSESIAGKMMDLETSLEG